MVKNKTIVDMVSSVQVRWERSGLLFERVSAEQHDRSFVVGQEQFAEVVGQRKQRDRRIAGGPAVVAAGRHGVWLRPMARDRGAQGRRPRDKHGGQHDGQVEIVVRRFAPRPVDAQVQPVDGGGRALDVPHDRRGAPQGRVQAAAAPGHGGDQRRHRPVEPRAQGEQVHPAGRAVIPAHSAHVHPGAVVEQRPVTAGLPNAVQHRPPRQPRHDHRTRAAVVVEKRQRKVFVLCQQPVPHQSVRARVHAAATFPRGPRGHQFGRSDGRRRRAAAFRRRLRSGPTTAVRAQHVPAKAKLLRFVRNGRESMVFVCRSYSGLP